VSLSDAVRLLGNKGAHSKVLPVSEKEADILDGFFKAFIEYIYVAPAKMEAYQEQLKNLKL